MTLANEPAGAAPSCPVSYVDAGYQFVDGVNYRALKNSSTGELVLLKYELGDDFTADGLAKVKVNGKFGFINKKLELVIPADFERAGDFTEGFAPVEKERNSFFIDTRGQRVSKPSFKPLMIVSEFSEGMVNVKVGNKWGYINAQGTIVIQPRFDFAHSFSEGLAAVRIEDSYGFIDRKGQLVIKPQFSSVGSHGFREGRVAVILPGESKYAFIDKTGKVIVPPISFWPWPFQNGITGFGNREQDGLINKDGQIIATGFLLSAGGSDRGEGLYVAMKPGGQFWGFIDEAGNWVLEPRFYYLSGPREGLAVAKTDESSRYGLINRKGDWIINPSFDLVNPPSNGMIRIHMGDPKSGQVGYIPVPQGCQ
ncbi:MAG: WG repeat-containing protein [Nitrospira sp.]|nr:WG repeat-containing protein [Nitrospira sp.]